MMLAVQFILLVVSVFIGYFGGYYLTEVYDISSRWDVFQFKAFECRPCLSFHISWVTSTLISLLFPSWGMLIIGIVFAFILYAGLKIDENNRFVEE